MGERKEEDGRKGDWERQREKGGESNGGRELV